jgi:hypothetical protein
MRWQWPVRTGVAIQDDAGATATGDQTAARSAPADVVPAVGVTGTAELGAPRQRGTRRWRVPGFRWPTRVTYPAPASEPAAALSDAPVAAEAPGAPGAVESREPGVLAVAIARVLIAIDFALPGRRDRQGR